MPGKARVHELAKELGLESKNVLAWLKDNGEFVKSASSTIEAPVARKLREAFPSSAGAAPTAARDRCRPPRRYRNRSFRYSCRSASSPTDSAHAPVRYAMLPRVL